MATEATSETLATHSTKSGHELNTTETSSQDVPSEQPVVNGNPEKPEVKQDAEHVEPNINSTEVSVSGGSDTEATKAEASKAQGDEKGHVRTTSTVKKIASFKPVSVNKTFLAAKGSTATAPSKLGDKAPVGASAIYTGPSATNALRPRLVAKSGSGLRDSTPRTTAAANGGKAGAAPDASAVWNKNRPAPPAEPKRFTDEELKQRYGIHLATRLQSDDPGKQANWADIDDDDDDWAPETIEWTDGTKITLPQADETPAPVPEPAPVSMLKDAAAAETVKPKSPAPNQISSSATVKPSGFGSGRAGLVLKGASERPTLVAKPPGPPTPVKSPWASLPPVDKVAPVAIEVQQQQPQTGRFSQRDPHGSHGMPPPPTKEIAADDFSRSWRENINSNRELYNSQSGRYEPVNDTRRGSMRNDARSHQPAVLQRPSLNDGPAEPSAAFQTHRASGQDGAYGRRRTSSNVSGGSGKFVRRMSKGHEVPPAHEMLKIRRGSLAAVSDAPSSPRNYSPSGQQLNQRGHQGQSQQWQAHQSQQSQSRGSPAVSHPSPQLTHGQAVPTILASSDGQVQPPAAPYLDPIEEQNKIMRTTRELAIKRRIEAEAREEAERKERIRVKLESMGPPPESRKKKAAPTEDVSVPTNVQIRETDDATVTAGPGIEGEGGEKVKKSSDIAPKKTVSPTEDKPQTAPPAKENNRANGAHQGRSAMSQNSQDGRSSSWQNNSAPASDRFKSWNAAPSPQSSSMNVWGPPTNDRTLGNGTFNPELSRLPDIHQSPHPGPIGPPHVNRSNNQFQQGRGREQYGSRPAPIGPPNRHQGASRQDMENKAAVARSGWNTLPDTLNQQEQLSAQQSNLELAKKLELKEKGLLPEIVGPVINETWRKVALNEDGTRGKVQNNVKAVHDPTQAWSAYPEKPQEENTTRSIFEDQEASRRHHFDAVGNQSTYSDSWTAPANTNASPSVRGSRFFPSHRDVRLEEQYINYDRPGSPSPPPPTMAGHPAYDGDIAHPHVSLPRPSPVVKLPPAPVLAPIGPPRKPASFAQAVQAPAPPGTNHKASYSSRQESTSRGTHAYQDIRRQEGSWQERIHSLVGRRSPKSHALAVDSSSKNALELPNQQVGATVSLPSVNLGDMAFDSGAVESKPAAEECFEEQEMGSLPVIKVPNLAPRAAWNLAATPKSLSRKLQASHVVSRDPVQFSQHIVSDVETINIRLPGQIEAKSVTRAVAPRQRSNTKRGGGSRARGASSTYTRGGRGRNSSGGYPPASHDNAPIASSANSSTRSGRGARGYGTAWGRHPMPAVHT
ncbi:hypothetical protein BUE80_DR013218 [Diplocarpon rosae]|nr:hypothetical protein BUE80_DR013218 [Diplocarpon rosae]